MVTESDTLQYYKETQKTSPFKYISKILNPAGPSEKSGIYNAVQLNQGREREMFYLTTHSTHFIYGYMASDIWLRTILIVRKETRCRHIGYSYRLTARVLLYAPSHREDNTNHGSLFHQSWSTGWNETESRNHRM